ncbi:hypothetical protein MNBD_IGNAVI01-2894 [hydrothermal vent metagenome]|uniref:Secretion system C-terminal sorting domain-containing protein n=1 Tax=hydrothermal vent metagenome TaxID=652676 RepID=A0A3B1C536_9ZZZZ
MKFKNHFFVLTFFVFASFLFYSSTYSQTMLVSPDSLYMGQIQVGSKNVRQFKIFNLSASTLQISSFSIDNNTDNSYKILNNPGSVSLGQLQSIILQIEFSPSSNDLKQAKLVIQSNASSSPDKKPIYGRGLTNSPPTFERVFGDEEDNIMNSVQQTSDAGYILGGSTILPGEDFTDLYLIKTNDLGEIQWETVYGGDDSETITSVLETSDGSYMAFGQTDSKGAGNFDFYLVKFSSTGDVIWEKTYGGNRDEKSAEMIKTQDGGYLLLGTTLSFGDGLNADVNLIKVSSDGSELWNKRYGGSSGDSGDKIILTQDDNYAILASTASFGAGGFDLWLIKIDNNGNELWNKTFGGSEDEEGNGITELQDGNLVMVGYTISFGAGAKDVYVIKTNSSGVELWNIVYGGLYQDFATNVISDDNGIIYTTEMQPELDSSSAFINKVDFDSNEIWRSRYYGNANDLVLNTDNHIIIAGSTSKYGNNSEVYFLNVNENGDITAVRDIERQNPTTFQLFNNYPNPFNPSTVISYQIPEDSFVRLVIYNAIGQEVTTLVNHYQTVGSYNINFNAGDLSTGIYIYRLKTRNFISAKKMILLK